MTPVPAYPKLDMVGQVFDSWTVLSFDRYSGTSPMWMCRCVCREVQSLKRFDLLRSAYKSCGCLDIRKGWIIDGIGYIPLTQGKVTMVKPYRVEELQKYKWCATLLRKKYYAYRYNVGGEKYNIPMARQILGLDRSDKRVGHHLSGNTLDNRDENLLAVTNYQNLAVSPAHCDSETGVKGVFPIKKGGVYSGRFQVKIMYKGVSYNLGMCDTAEEGREIYNAAALKFHGEIAVVK